MLVRRFFLVLFLFCNWILPPAFCQEKAKPDTIAHAPNDSTDWLDADTVKIKSKKHSPTKATIYAIVLPGLGQAYNRQYWKLPIVYGVGAFLITQIVSNNYDLMQANRDLNLRVTNDNIIKASASAYAANPSSFHLTYDYYDIRDTTNPKTSDRVMDRTQLQTLRDSYRRDRDFYVIMTALTYTLSIIDATVFAHLREFEVSDKLTMKIDPQIKFAYGTTHPTMGISCSLHFK